MYQQASAKHFATCWTFCLTFPGSLPDISGPRHSDFTQNESLYPALLKNSDDTTKFTSGS